ncbi:MAG: polymer-forming cytoskeletal protein [Ignavibacteriaceae bacterium]|nr:polymer-forming cytoskeletal protein [Ignavibacteriaceae bacterium]
MKTRPNDLGKDEVTIISAGVSIEGKLNSNGNVRIDGDVRGDVVATGNVTVGENGEVNGELRASVVTIGGRVNGTIHAKEKLVLESKATLKGDLVTKILVIEAGANFEGNSSMGGSLEAPKSPGIQPGLK